MVKIWRQATEEVGEAMEENFPQDNPISRSSTPARRATMTQVRSSPA